MLAARSLRKFPRAMQSVPFGDALAKVYDRWSNLLIVRDHGKGAPSYREGEAAAVYTATVDTAALPNDPNTTPPTSGVFDLQPFGGFAFYWKNDTATHDTISVVVWARADTGDWLTVGRGTILASLTETVFNGTGYRQIFVQVTGTAGGADGDVILLAGGD